MSAYYVPTLNEVMLFYIYCLASLLSLIPIATEKRFTLVKMMLAAFFMGYLLLLPFSPSLPPNQEWISHLHPVYLLSVVCFLYLTRKSNSESVSYMIMLCLTLMVFVIYLASLAPGFILIGSSETITNTSKIARVIITEEDMIKLCYSLSVIVIPYMLWLRKRKAITIISLSSLLLVLCYLFWPRPHLEGVSLFFFPIMFLFTGYITATNTSTATGVYAIPHFLFMGLSLIVSFMVIVSTPNMWYSGFLVG